MSSLWLKLALMPLLLLLISWISRRHGPRVAGLLTGLPLVSGPVSVFLATGSGAKFASGAAPGALSGLAGVGAFCGAYAWASRRASWPYALAWALGGFLVSALLLQRTPQTLISLSLAAMITLMAVRAVLARADRAESDLAPLPESAAWELPARMVVATALVLGLTAASEHLGPALSGICSTVPVLSAVVAVFTHARGGARAVRTFLTGVAGASIGSVGFFAVVGGRLEPGALVGTYAMALAAAAALNVACSMLAGSRGG